MHFNYDFRFKHVLYNPIAISTVPNLLSQPISPILLELKFLFIFFGNCVWYIYFQNRKEIECECAFDHCYCCYTSYFCFVCSLAIFCFVCSYFFYYLRLFLSPMLFSVYFFIPSCSKYMYMFLFISLFPISRCRMNKWTNKIVK